MIDNGYLKTNIKIKEIKNADGVKFKGLDEKQLWQLRKEIHRTGNMMHICLFELLINTGIRVSELCNITLPDIEISERKGFIHVIGKGNKERTLPLNKDAREAIKDYLQVRSETIDNHLLIGQRGGIQRNAVDIILKQYGSKLNIDVSAHKLRHTLAYKLICNKDVAITTVQSILGHADVRTTMIYTQTMDRDKQKALENIEW